MGMAAHRAQSCLRMPLFAVGAIGFVVFGFGLCFGYSLERR